MALQDDFESVRACIHYQTPLPTIDKTLAELMAEEARKGTFDNFANVSDSVLATLHSSTFNSTGKNSITNRKPFNDISQVRCNYYKGFGHIKYNCPIKLKKKALAQGLTTASASATPSAMTITSAYLTT
ncbi:hypothetical protein AMTR_s00091p00082480 [Amborella trichopoda]|uniref:Uncharacterized protein n=1 Tax=Amborella trichopoda TaxID=13333 RepID=W1NY71_AMBTC|nr:hypothetical protein AMTR_s00091p00082480 [Amborella trichopoda]